MRPQKDKELARLLEAKSVALKTFIELHRPLEEAVNAELARTKSGKELLRDQKELVQKVSATWKLVSEKRLSRAAAWKTVGPQLDALKSRMQPHLMAVYAKHEDIAPNHRTVIRTLLGADALSTPWFLQVVWLPVYLFTPVSNVVPSDVGVVQQALDDPPPFGLCKSPAYALQESGVTWQLLGGGLAFPGSSSGSFFSNSWCDFNGGAACHAIVGDDFSIPQGHTDFEVTADIDWSYSGWTFAVGGASVAGAELVLVVERGDGSSRTWVTQSLFTLVSPLSWGSGASGTGSTKLSLSFSVASNKARTVRVFAGGRSHAECGSTFAAGAYVTVFGQGQDCLCERDLVYGGVPDPIRQDGPRRRTTAARGVRAARLRAATGAGLQKRVGVPDGTGSFLETRVPDRSRRRLSFAARRVSRALFLWTLHDGSCAVRRAPAVVTRRQGDMSWRSPPRQHVVCVRQCCCALWAGLRRTRVLHVWRAKRDEEDDFRHDLKSELPRKMRPCDSVQRSSSSS
jgi:hypothetical protein